MRSRIDLYTITTTPDGEGGTTPTYTKTSTRYAEVLQLSQGEAMRSGMVAGERNYKITMRRGPQEQLDRSTQIRIGTRRLNITSIISDVFWFYINAIEKT